MSALMAQGWLTARDTDVCSYFVGARPEGLESLIGPRQRETVRFAAIDPRIGGTLALEHRPASAKLMLAVPEGRFLDEALAERARKSTWDVVGELRPSVALLGVGGLNKAKPALACSLVRLMRRRVRNCVIFAAGSSFAREATASRPPAFWSDLNQLFAAADVVSVSRSERQQLAAVWGDDWPNDLVTKGSTRLVVMHSAHDVVLCRAPLLADCLDGLDGIVDAAQQEASRHAAASLTGSGARFDGVLSAGILANWRC
jgi:hypothetical protein